MASYIKENDKKKHSKFNSKMGLKRVKMQLNEMNVKRNRIKIRFLSTFRMVFFQPKWKEEKIVNIAIYLSFNVFVPIEVI